MAMETNTAARAETLLDVKDLNIRFKGKHGTVSAVEHLDFSIRKGELLALVGESGCGKSVTSLAVMDLIERPGEVQAERMLLNGNDLTKLSAKEKRRLRGVEMAMIFQDPLTSLNPLFTVGNQISEQFLTHIPGCTKQQAKEKSIEIIRKTGIPRPEAVYNSYPHELSGGMRQRVMIAIALSCNPKLLIADEPTTALDVTIQAQILDLLRQLKDRINSSIMFITHDLGVIAEMADYVVVMYAGRVVEKGTAEEIFAHPAHPYTIGLMASKPVVGKKVDKLYSIPGKVPNPINMPHYCYFRDRCEMQCEGCSGDYPQEIRLSPTHTVSCYRYTEENRKGGEA